ncbi:hypothetical protein Tco_0218139 [Tanacetum coccineum]
MKIKRGIHKPEKKIKGFYRGCLGLGNEYKYDQEDSEARSEHEIVQPSLGAKSRLRESFRTSLVAARAQSLYLSIDDLRQQAGDETHDMILIHSVPVFVFIHTSTSQWCTYMGNKGVRCSVRDWDNSYLVRLRANSLLLLCSRRDSISGGGMLGKKGRVVGGLVGNSNWCGVLRRDDLVIVVGGGWWEEENVLTSST